MKDPEDKSSDITADRLLQTMATFKAMNYGQRVPDVTKPFQISCPSGTDIYDKPPSTHRFDAPVLYTTTSASAFKSATISVSGEWTYKYDQGGLCMVINFKDGSRRWIKTGIEYLENKPMISVVTKDRWADWSLRPLLVEGATDARVSIENMGDGNLWVFVIGQDGGKHPVREVTWWAEIQGDTEILIGPAAAKPSLEGGDLVVQFTDFDLELA